MEPSRLPGATFTEMSRAFGATSTKMANWLLKVIMKAEAKLVPGATGARMEKESSKSSNFQLHRTRYSGRCPLSLAAEQSR